MQHIGGGMWSNLISAAASSQGSAERGGGTPAPKSHRCPGQPNWCGDTAQSYLDDRILCHRTKKKKMKDAMNRYLWGMWKEYIELKFLVSFWKLLTGVRLFRSLTGGHSVTPFQFWSNLWQSSNAIFFGVLIFSHNIHRSLGTIRARDLHLKFRRTMPLARPCCKYFSCRREIEQLSAEL